MVTWKSTKLCSLLKWQIYMWRVTDVTRTNGLLISEIGNGQSSDQTKWSQRSSRWMWFWHGMKVIKLSNVIQSNVTWPTLTNLSSSHSQAAINWVWLWSGCVKSTSTTMQIWTVKEADYIIDPCSLKIGSEHPSQTVRILWRISNFWRLNKTGVVVVLTQLKGWGDSRAIKIPCSWFHEICGNQKLLGMFRISVLRPILAEDNLYYFAFHQLVWRESHNNGCHIKVD